MVAVRAPSSSPSPQSLHSDALARKQREAAAQRQAEAAAAKRADDRRRAAEDARAQSLFAKRDVFSFGGGLQAKAPVLGPPAPVTTPRSTLRAGEESARAAVDVDGEATAKERSGLEGDIGRIDAATRREAESVFTRAGAAVQPRGTTATIDGDRAEIVTRDRSGKVTAREIAVRDGDDVTYERTDYKGGNATRQTYEAKGDEVSVKTADWKGVDPSNPSWEELEDRAGARCESGIALREVRYRDSGDELETREKVVTAEGRNEVSKKYKTQTGGDGIHGKLEEPFDTDETIHVVETSSKSKKWGEDEESVEEWSYEQGDVRASAVDAEDDEAPKQWRLEKQDANVYKSQTFYEGNEDFTTITERRAEGSTVTETSTAKGKNDDGTYEARTAGTTVYATDGTIAEQHIDETDASGVRTERDYSRTEDRDGHFREEVSSRIVAKDGAVTEASKSVEGIEKDGVEKITGVSTTVTGPGGTAVSSYTEKGGQQLTVNGKPVALAERSDELAALTEEEKDLAAQAATDVLSTIKSAAEHGKNVIDLTKLAGVGASSALPNGTSVSDRLNRRLDQQNARLEARFGTQRVTNTNEYLLRGASGAKAGVGAIAALASGASLISNIQQQNWAKASIDAGNVAVGGANVVVGARELSALRATPNGALAIDDLGSMAGRFGQFAKLGGLGVGVAAGGYQVVDGIIKGDGVSIAQGGVGIAGTLGAFAAGGAVGGPAGVLVGMGIGLGTLGVQWGIRKIWGDDEPKMAKVEI